MRRVWQWMLRAGFSILDQGLLSASNFGLSIFLARVLPDTDYGAFALNFNIFLIISGFHNSLFVEPMSVFGPARHLGDLTNYLRRSVWLHVAFMSLVAAAGLLAAFILRGNRLAPSLASMAITSMPVLLFWLVRRAHYIETRPGLAAMSSGVYLVTLSLTAVLLWRAGWLDAAGGFWAMGAAGLVASLFSLSRLGVGMFPGMAAARTARPLIRENWEYGRWVLPSALLYPLLSQAQIFLTFTYLGLASTGVLRVLQNPILPVMQIVTALSTLAVPVLSRDFSEGRVSAMYRRGMIYTAVMTMVAVSYELAVFLTGNLWDKLLYNGRYAEYDWLMPVLGLLPIATAIGTGLSVIFRAVQRPQLVTLMHVFGGILGASLSYYLIRKMHLPGAVYGMVASQTAAAAVSIVLIFTLRGREGKRESPAPAS